MPSQQPAVGGAAQLQSTKHAVVHGVKGHRTEFPGLLSAFPTSYRKPDYVGRGLEAGRECGSGKRLKVDGLASESGLTHLGLTASLGFRRQHVA